MKPILDFLTANPVTYFATVAEGNQPKVRPIQFCLEENGILWFCSAKSKNFWKEMQLNPQIELTSFDGNCCWVRVAGSVSFNDQWDIKKKILDQYDSIRQIYHSPDNPEFVAFCLEHWNATLFSFTDSPVSFSR
ncbi:MAG: pyridoxamine 5'-phosphate oxidase family protein [Planctomycetaceae bacterium]|jgi:uncharacterized pyridoxamine 5'-phosphate oxidase family protein|nr:pyridoxamine 5'-phosphate oxidase family protein [Planctomycetaceae bacterium]